MLLENERELLVAYGRKLINHRLTTGTGGNLSIFNREKGLLALTPTGHATTLSCLNWDLPAVHYLVAFAGNEVKCARYATFGSEELARSAFEGMKDRKAVLLANHGLLAGGKDLPFAFDLAEIIEFCAEIYYRSKCIGEPVIISTSEMEAVAEKLKCMQRQSKGVDSV
jgi:L-fuculose-phosphate aldolase